MESGVKWDEEGREGLGHLDFDADGTRACLGTMWSDLP